MAEIPTLWGYPIVTDDAVPVETIVTVPLPSDADLLIYGSFENYIKAKKRELGLLGSDDTD